MKSKLKTKYATVAIGTQHWMVENLNVTQFRNGDEIFHAETDEQWREANNNKIPAWCYLLNDSENGEKYGKLYNWHAVSDPRGLAAEGFKIPTDEDWKVLERTLGMPEVEVNEKVKDAYRGIGTSIGSKLKSSVKTRNGSLFLESSNESGFSGLPGGMRDSLSRFSSIGSSGYWWCFGQDDEGRVWRRYLLFTEYENSDSVFRGFVSKGYGLSVRCVVDTEYDSYQIPEQVINSESGILTITDEAFIKQSSSGHIQILAEVKNRQLDGDFEDFYSNGNKKSKGVIKDEKKEGVWVGWYENGQLAVETTFQNDLDHGVRKEWYPNGNIKLIQEYSTGIQCGLSKSWYENGQLMSVQNYKQGLKDGLREEWYENGLRRLKIDFVEGKVTGLYEFWYENGTKWLKFAAINNIYNGEYQQWNREGQMISKSLYVNGKKEGLHEEWYDNGQVKIRGNFKYDLLNGTYSDWYENGQVKVKTTYKDGLFNGLLEEWFSNGQLKARGEMQNGRKVGDWELWDADGGLIEKRRL